VNATHKANKRQRRLRSLHARIEAKEAEQTGLIKHTNIDLHQKHTVEVELKTLRRQLANIL
jgi:hypothetical protein